MDQDKKNISSLLLLLVLFCGVIVLFDWLSISQLTDSEFLLNFSQKLHPRIYLFRSGYVILVWLSCYFMPGRKLGKSMTENWKVFSVSFSVLFSVLIAIGPSAMDIYNKIIYPAILLLHLPLVALSIAALSGALKSEKFFAGISHEKSDFSFEFITSSQETLIVNSPQQNIWIDGGPGSGKSATFIKSIITQSAFKGYAGWVYDWEAGNPEYPILGQIVYGSLMAAKEQNPDLNLSFAFINFTDMLRTVRVNVLSERYFTPNNVSLFLQSIATTLMKNLEPSWREKTDFWANNAINYVYSVMYICYKNRDKGINTLPHVISICLSDCDAVFRWIKEDREISKNMASMISAWELGAQQQTAGAVSSAQLPLALLNNRYIYWVLSPRPEDEFNLDITNKEHPTLLCVGNSPLLKVAVSPAISCIANVVMTQMNQPGKAKSIFCNDEFPTINLYGIGDFIGTARKHYVATILALQTFQQAKRDYGEQTAKILRDNCGNQFVGMTGSGETAESIEKLLGDYKEVNISFSEQDSGGGSRSESLQKERVIKARDIAGQKSGHFFGKIANGNPPYLFTQFALDEGISKPIPPFACPVNIKDPEMMKKIMEELVERNYQRIENETEKILSEFVNPR